MGADKGILVKGDKSDAFSVAQMLSSVINERKPDIVLMGKQSIDFDGMEIAPMLSELTGMPSATVVVSLAISGTTATAEREVEGGKEKIELAMPCIIAAQKGLNDPRYPSLPNIMKAKQKPIEEITGSTPAARTNVVKMTKPEKKRVGKILKVESDAKATAHELAKLLHEEAKLI